MNGKWFRRLIQNLGPSLGQRLGFEFGLQSIHQNLILLVLVCLLGFTLFRDISTPPIDERASGAFSFISVATRAPANIGDSGTHGVSGSSGAEGEHRGPSDGVWTEPFHAITLHWDCRSSHLRVRNPRIRHVQLEGDCLRWIRHFKNTKNNYSIDIFLGERFSVTDYFAVEVGANRLQMTWEKGAPRGAPQTIDLSLE